MCLLSLILDVGRGKDVVVLHVDHGIRTESARDRLLVEKFCSEHGIAYRAFCIDVPALSAQNGNSIETQARLSRHQIFDQFCKEKNVPLLLAHNKGDNVETILMHIFRGCGLRGLVGMSEFSCGGYSFGLSNFSQNQLNNFEGKTGSFCDYCIRVFVRDSDLAPLSRDGNLQNRENREAKHVARSEFDGIEKTYINQNIECQKTGKKSCCKTNRVTIRPLLSVPKSEIYNYVRKNDIPFVEDETNTDTNYRRNHIRALIPEIETSFDGMQDAVLSLARIAAKTESFMQSQLDPSFFIIDNESDGSACSYSFGGEGDGSISAKTAALSAAEGIRLDPRSDAAVGAVLLDKRAFDGFLAAEYVMRAVKMTGQSTDLEEKHIEAVCNLAKLPTGKSIDLPHGLRAYNEGKYLAFAFARPFCEDIIPFCEGENSLCRHVIIIKERNVANIFAQNMGDNPDHCLGSAEKNVTGLRRHSDLGSSVLGAKRTNSLFVDADGLEGAVLRFRREGDRFHPCGGKPKKLKEYLNGKKIPNRKKDSLPLLVLGSEVLVICGLELSDRVKLTDRTKKIFEISMK